MDEPAPSSRYLRLKSQNGVTIVNFVDIQISPDAKELLYGLVEKKGHKRLLLNLSNISSMSTMALGILANLQKKVTAAGGQMSLCCLSADIINLFHMTKFDQVFTVHANQEEALSNF